MFGLPIHCALLAALLGSRDFLQGSRAGAGENKYRLPNTGWLFSDSSIYVLYEYDWKR